MQGCINWATRCFSESSGNTYLVREEDGQATCSLRVAKPREPVSLRSRQAVQAPGGLTGRKAVVSMFPSSTHAAKCPPGKILNKMKKKRRTPFSFEEENGKYSWSVDGDFKHRHHEVLRTKQYFPNETTFSAPKKCVDVMRQRRTSVDSASRAHAE